MRKMLAPSCAFLLTFAVCAWGADFWAARPFTDWSDKEIQKLIENSPWAKEYSIAIPGTGGGGTGGGRRERGGGTMGEADTGGSGGGSRYGTMGQTSGNSAITGADSGGGGSMQFVIRWQSALPVKQALVRGKFGAEAATSPDAKRILDAQEPSYVIVVSGLNRGMVGRDADEFKQTMLQNTALVVKGKEPIKPNDFRVAGQGRVEIIFAFPKTTPIVEDDKEVEFQCKLGTTNIKQKFSLKQMMFNGKLEL